MKATKESAIQHLRNAIVTRHMLGLLGIPLGYAISYLFQPSRVLSFDMYVMCIKDVLKAKELAPTAISVTLIVAIFMACLGRWLASRARISVSKILTEEEMRLNAEKGAGSGNLVFGKIKKGEDNLRGSAKRIGKMLFIALGSIILILVLVVLFS